MLATFADPASSGITVFGDVAWQPFWRMGHSSTSAGALPVENVTAAIHD